MDKRFVLTAVSGLFLSASVNAAVVSVDLSSASSGTFIDGGGADFAGTFVGQSIVAGTGISGSPTNPLTLAPSNNLNVAFFDPGVSVASNSILPEPGNQGPLSILLDSPANSITWTMGSAQPPSSVEIAFFDFGGNLVHSLTQSLFANYDVYTFEGFGNFGGLTISNNNDPAGLRYMNISYNAVPIPAAVWLFGSGLLGLVGIARRKKAA